MKQTLIRSALAVSLLAATTARLPSARADDAKTAEEGKEIYSDNCATCHGEQLRNTCHGVTFDLRTLKPNEHERFVNSVVNGKNQMPPWRDVLDDGHTSEQPSIAEQCATLGVHVFEICGQAYESFALRLNEISSHHIGA